MGCLEEDRVGLLHLKSFLTISIPSLTAYNSDYDLLPSWIDHEKSYCCGWERVTCNSTTGHVIELSLHNLMQDLHLYYERGKYYEELPWLLNVSLLEPFKELRSLDLSSNAIDGCIRDEGFEKLSTLRNLENLNLGYNLFDDNSILQSLGAITSLKTLNLTWNMLEGYFPAEELVTLRNLNTLDISSNSYNGTLPNQGFERLAVLRNLETLILDGNNFGYSIIPSLSNLTSLMTLSLSGNMFWADHERVNAEGTFERLAVLRNLKTLNLDRNNVDDMSIIPSLSGLTSLKTLNLAYNDLRGENYGEGWKMLSRLENLEKLDLSHNYLNDTSFLQSIAAIKSLKTLNLKYNELTGSFPTKVLANLSNLEVLILAGNHFGGRLATQEFCALKKLEVLDLSYNYFEGILPPCINNMTSLVVLDISDNQFNGNASSSYVEASGTSLEYIAFSYNQFVGIFSFKLFANYSKLEVLGFNGQNNKVEIETEGSMGWSPLFQLKIIQLSNCSLNKLTSSIPKFLLVQHKLDIVNLSHRSLPICLNLPKLEHLYLQGNKFTGSIPKVLFNSSSLLTLDIGDNNFSDSISVEIKQLQALKVLLLSGNRFTGIIPNQLCLLRMIRIMDLSKNGFSGTIPQCLHDIYFGKTAAPSFDYFSGKADSINLFMGSTYTYKGFSNGDVDTYAYLEYVDVEVEIEFVTKYRHTSYKGSILGYMSGLDFSCNNLTGGIPPALGQISSLHALNLSYNQLIGKIPITFSKLALLESLDLSHNSLSGEIPSALIDLTFLEVFNVAYNNLSGKVPDMKAQFGTFEKSSYEGNLLLCGPPLDKSCSKGKESDPTPTQSSNEGDRKWYEIDPMVFHTSFSATTSTGSSFKVPAASMVGKGSKGLTFAPIFFFNWDTWIMAYILVDGGRSKW
ncbi:receptor-like protein 56 [Juglans regia]|uniref:Receptor-like protein 56 n=1 Tax=Juglans regia TaxID=51240 RepID=A0A6P9EU24_JUGRE|nr:receptor-like protein 56 [Juglans regia]